MAIVNGYATLAEFKAFAVPDGAADVVDDAVIEDIIEAVSRWIDGKTARTFYARAGETRYYDTPDGRELWLDDDLLAVTTLTNGNGSVVAAADYVLLPNNASPKYAIKLLAGTSITWERKPTYNTPERAITVLGNWGYSATAPDDIRQACLLAADNIYRRRFGENTSGIANVTAAGIVITPADIPGTVLALLRPYVRVAP